MYTPLSTKNLNMVPALTHLIAWVLIAHCSLTNVSRLRHKVMLKILGITLTCLGIIKSNERVFCVHILVCIDNNH